MFDLWITLLHIVLVSGLITLAAFVRKRSAEEAVTPAVSASETTSTVDRQPVEAEALDSDSDPILKSP